MERALLHIALACNNPWGSGGQGNFLRRAAGGLMPHGRLAVYCLGAASGRPSEMHLQPVAAPRVPTLLKKVPLVRRRKDWMQLASDLAFDREVARRVRAAEEAPDLFVGVALQSRYALEAAKARGARTWLYGLNTYLPFMKAEVEREYALLREWGAAAIHPWALRRFAEEYRLADAVVVNSHVAARTFQEAGRTEKPIHVIHPVVDTERFRPVPRQAAREPFTVLYVGTVTPRKGLHYLVEAFRRLGTGFRLLLVGGASTRRMKQLLDEARRALPVEQVFRDFSRDDPTEIFGQADVLVLPSVEDGFGVVALEAMASGVPVITTDHCGAADIVEEGVNGFVVPARDVEALADRLAWMARHRSETAAMGVAARATALRFTQAQYDARMADLVEAAFPVIAAPARPLLVGSS